MSRSILGFAIAFCCTAPSGAQDWPRFRGPNGAGCAAAQSLPSTFDTASEAWREELAPSQSSPIVVGELVIACTTAEKELAIHAFDARTGAPRWKHALERTRAMEVYEANDTACPSPTSDGRSIYAFFPELGLVACDLAGKELWRLPLGPFHCFYGLASSPIAAGDLVVLLCEQQSGSFLLGVDAAKGTPRWRTERSDAIDAWTTPVLWPASGTPQEVLVHGSFYVAGYALRDGVELWRKGGFSYAPVSSPLVDGERLYVCAPAQVEARMPTFASMAQRHDANADQKLTSQELGSGGWAKHFGWIDADRSGEITSAEWTKCAEAMANADHGLAALVREEGGLRELWRHKRPLPGIASPLYQDGVVYLMKDGGILTSIDAATGELRKSERLKDASGEFWASPIAADGRLYLAERDGQIYTVRAGAAWELEARSELGEPIFGTPAIAHGALFVRTQSSLRCYRRPAKG
ncbi:MAG: PQQ-binding-like beta-propeller repeat protein [Planctomycetes bacterium]|nr:PQQ-binding-like beta-propeller repeat protein [Planctomycetota bacterium]